jgi:hypothetical protein
MARDAYVYGFPLVDNYRILHSYFVDRDQPEFRAPWNQIHSTARVFTPDDKAVQTPNADTPYTTLAADLRAEPLVVTLPPVDPNRYVSAQFIDLYTFNFAYAGSRSTGNGGGRFLLAGPGWHGGTGGLAGCVEVIRCETELALVLFRTQLFSPADIANVRAVQAGYAVEPLSTFLGRPAPPAPPRIDFVKPLTATEERTKLEFFDVLNFVLRFCPTAVSERALRERFAEMGVGPGLTFDPAALAPDVRKAVVDGVADAWKLFAEFKSEQLDTGRVASGDCFGTRAFLANNYLRRMSAAVLGIYGNSKEEAMYPAYFIDAAGQKLDATNRRYALRFAPGRLPPVRAFWSVTLYELPSSLLSPNPLGRYLINSAMLPDLVRDADGGLTLLIQHTSPGPAREPNWLPAPRGPFFCVLRLYWPDTSALDGTWKQPPMQRIA